MNTPPYEAGMLRRLILTLAACALLGAAPAPAKRIVTLVPSLAEDLFAIGAGDRVVGVSSYTDQPVAARRLPVVASFSSVATERVIGLRSDAIVGIPSQRAMIEDARRAGIRTVLVPDDSFDDVFTDITAMGDVSGRRAQADALVARLRARTRALTARVRAHRAPPRVFVVLGERPIFTIGDASYIAHLITLAGGRNAAGALRTPYAQFSAEALVALQPDVLIVDRDVARAAELHTPPWSLLRAVRAHRVYVAPESAALYRPGPRYNDGLAWLIGVLNRV